MNGAHVDYSSEPNACCIKPPAPNPCISVISGDLQAHAQRHAALRLAAAFGQAPIKRARLCVCGFERAGKTTLVRALRGLAHAATDRTLGIEVTNVALDGVDFSIWDYAGAGPLQCQA